MGWLFAVALGLHRQSRVVVLVSLVPILIGHAAAIALVLYAAIAFGFFFAGTTLYRAAGLLLLGWAAWHAIYGHRRRVRVGMQTGLAGLAAWSLVMATAHGAGLMLLPVALPLCLPSGSAAGGGSLAAGLTVVGVHTLAMLAVVAAVALTVYDVVGLGFLRRGWFNLDLLWSIALALAGFIMLLIGTGATLR
jgi:hypothetical protein